MTCKKCKSTYDDSIEVCPKCGTVAQSNKKMSKMMYVLAFFSVIVVVSYIICLSKGIVNLDFISGGNETRHFRNIMQKFEDDDKGEVLKAYEEETTTEVTTTIASPIIEDNSGYSTTSSNSDNYNYDYGYNYENNILQNEEENKEQEQEQQEQEQQEQEQQGQEQEGQEQQEQVQEGQVQEKGVDKPVNDTF